MSLAQSLLGELEEALSTGTSDKRTTTLRRVTDLLLGEADRLTDEQVVVFDDVLMYLIKRVEIKALIQLSTSIANLPNAPLETLRDLARNSEITVAGPILINSACLSEVDLIEIAKSKGQDHLLAISQRSSLSESLTDVLLERGQWPVAHALVKNRGARFSESGFAALVKRAESDNSLAEWVGQRLDIPLGLLRQLLAKASEIVCSKLLASAPHAQQEQIKFALADIAKEITLEAAKPRDYQKAEGVVQSLNLQGKLNEAVLLYFAEQRMHEEMVATLSLFCGVPTQIMEKLTKNLRPDGLILACKAAKLNWPTVVAIMKVRFSHHFVTEDELTMAKMSFLKLSQAAAQRAIRFMKAQDVAKLRLSEVAE